MKMKAALDKKNAASVRALFLVQLCTPLLPFLPKKIIKNSQQLSSYLRPGLLLSAISK